MPKVPTEPLDLVGFYLPRRSVDWTGEITGPDGVITKEPSMTKQSFKEECDINTIVRRFEATGQIDHINAAAAKGLYTDLPTGLDLQAGLDMIRNAEAAFMALPAAARAHFQNDPVLFVEAMNSPSAEDLEVLDRHGLAKRVPDPEPPPAGPKPDTPPEGK